MHSKKIIGAIAFSAITAAVLTACGGSGDTQGRYSVEVTASPSSLPINYAQTSYTGISTYNPYYSIVRVEVKEWGGPAPTTQVGCNVSDVRLGGLFKLDDVGEEEEVTDENGNVDTRRTGAELFQNITGETNSGAISFGFLSLDGSGTARVTCTVTSPRDNMVQSQYADIQVGFASGLPALINAGGFSLAPRDVQPLRVEVFDAALQRVPDPVAANVLVQVMQQEQTPENPYGSVSTDPDKPVWEGVRLGDTPGVTTVETRTFNGVAQVPVTAGGNRGTLALLVTTDRSDNDVTNGIGDPVQYIVNVAVGN